jgi:hypothetical protein
MLFGLEIPQNLGADPWPGSQSVRAVAQEQKIQLTKPY